MTLYEPPIWMYFYFSGLNLLPAILLCLPLIALLLCILDFGFSPIVGNLLCDTSRRASVVFVVFDPVILVWLCNMDVLSLSMMFFAGFGALFPRAYFRKSIVFLLSIWCLLFISRSIFLFLYIRIFESYCLWHSCSSRSLWTRLRKFIMKFSYFLRRIFSCLSNFSIILSWCAIFSNYSNSSARYLK